MPVSCQSFVSAVMSISAACASPMACTTSGCPAAFAFTPMRSRQNAFPAMSRCTVPLFTVSAMPPFGGSAPTNTGTPSAVSSRSRTASVTSS